MYKLSRLQFCIHKDVCISSKTHTTAYIYWLHLRTEVLEKCTWGNCKDCKNVCKKISKITDMILYFYIASYLKVPQKTPTKQGQPHQIWDGKELIYNNNTTQDINISNHFLSLKLMHQFRKEIICNQVWIWWHCQSNDFNPCFCCMVRRLL